MQRLSVKSTALMGLLALAPLAHADTCGGVTMTPTVTVDGTTLTLNGMGIREATVFNVDVYVAGLYVEHRGTDGAALARADEKKRLVMRFVRDVGRDDLVEAFNEGFQRNAGGSLAALQPRIAQLTGYLAATHNNTNWTFTYIPGTGLRVQIDSATRGTIPGEDFARVFFSIWLGAHPPNGGLRRGLLGGECG